jgi:hypothetical protein
VEALKAPTRFRMQCMFLKIVTGLHATGNANALDLTL